MCMTNVMYTPRVLFSRLFLKICLFVLSVYTVYVGRLVTLPYEIMCPLSYASAVIIDSEGKVWSVYIHKVNRIMRLRDMTVSFFSKWPPTAILDLLQPEMAPFDPPSPKTPPQNQTWRWSDDPFQSYGHLKFSKMREWALRSVVGRWSSVVNIHTSCTDVTHTSSATLGS